MRIDLTVLAIPAFIGAMGAEYVWQRRHPTPVGTDRAGDYRRADTIASLTMGMGSLIAPFVSKRLLDPVTPGRGRWAKTLVGGAVVAAAAATVGDVITLRYAAGGLPEPGTLPPRAGTEAAQRHTARTSSTTAWQRLHGGTAVAAVGATALTAATTWAAQTSGARLFAASGRDLGSGAFATGLAILGWDAIYYWNHRLSHESRWLWAVHVAHHSSERYNLSTALRQPVAEGVTLSVPAQSGGWRRCSTRPVTTGSTTAPTGATSIATTAASSSSGTSSSAPSSLKARRSCTG